MNAIKRHLLKKLFTTEEILSEKDVRAGIENVLLGSTGKDFMKRLTMAKIMASAQESPVGLSFNIMTKKENDHYLLVESRHEISVNNVAIMRHAGSWFEEIGDSDDE